MQSSIWLSLSSSLSLLEWTPLFCYQWDFVFNEISASSVCPGVPGPVHVEAHIMTYHRYSDAAEIQWLDMKIVKLNLNLSVVIAAAVVVAHIFVLNEGNFISRVWYWQNQEYLYSMNNFTLPMVVSTHPVGHCGSGRVDLHVYPHACNTDCINMSVWMLCCMM